MTHPNFQNVGFSQANGWRAVALHGSNLAVGSTFEPITSSGFYRTPQVGSAVNLRVRAGGNANDTATGSGARSIYLQGLDENGDEIEETISTAGASASLATTKKFFRLFKAEVSASGTYATQTAGSHAGDISIEDAVTGDLWALIVLNGFPKSTSEIAAYTVPRGYEAFVSQIRLQVEDGRRADAIFFQRKNVLQTAAPYSPMVDEIEFLDVIEDAQLDFQTGLPYPPLTDIGLMGKANQSDTEIAADIYLVLRRTSL